MMKNNYMDDFVSFPSVPKYINEDGSIPSLEEFDRTVITESGYDSDSGKGKEILDNAVADSDDKKLFLFTEKGSEELKQTFPIDETVYHIVEDPSFDEYWRTMVIKNLDTERDKLLLEQINDSFIGDEVYRELNSLSKLEVFYYVGFFQKILSKTENADTMSIIDIDDKEFDEMPKVTRIY